MNDSFEPRLVSILPQSSTAVVVPPMMIETTYHQSRCYELVLLDPSYADRTLKTVIADTLFDEVADAESTHGRSEQVDFLGWHLIPVFAQQLSWLQSPDGRWSRRLDAGFVNEWFGPRRRYCVMVQGFDHRGQTPVSKLLWMKADSEEHTAEEIVDAAHDMDGRDVVMYTCSVFEPRLMAAFSVLRPHPALMRRDGVDGE